MHIVLDTLNSSHDPHIGRRIYGVAVKPGGKEAWYSETTHITDPVAVAVVDALCRVRDDQKEFIAELQDAATSAAERHAAEIESVKDELSKANEGAAWAALSPAEKDAAIRGAA
jgi:hypothetical protein